MKLISNKSTVLLLQVFAFIYILFLMIYNFLYLKLPEILNTIIGVFVNLFTLPIVFIIIPLGVFYSIYQIYVKKINSNVNWTTLFISLVSIVVMILGTIFE